MSSVEAQESLTNSLQLSPSTPKTRKDSSDVREEHDSSINAIDKEKTTAVTTDTTDSIKDAAKATNCDNNEKEEEVIILENDTSGLKCNIDRTECIEKMRRSDTNTSIAGSDSKMNKSENSKEITSKGGSSIKRKRRTIVDQEADSPLEENSVRSKRKKKSTNDRFCWRCHKESVEAHCSACPRSWHRRCIGMQPSSEQSWICGECAAILRAENAETRSTAMAQLSVDQLCLLLKHVVERMREYPGSEPFWKPVELSEAPSYLDYVVKPMDLHLLESNVRAKLYGSTDAFMADAKWIQHNCIVFNTCGGVYTDTSKLTNAAKQMIKLARQEVSEIEACPDCYAHGRNLPRPQPSWFIEPCRRPHALVWAKLKGFPFWPAKAMPRINSQGFVDVRFFGEHDRAWVSPRDLYLYSEDPPAPLPRKRKLDMEECVREITRHCRKLELVFGEFKFAPPKVQYNPHDPMQIKLMLPNYDPHRANNCIPSQFFTPKKKSVVKKRLSVKNKWQSDPEKTDASDVEHKTLTDSDTSTEHSKMEQNLSRVKTPERSEQVQVKTKIKSVSVANAPLESNESMNKENKTDIYNKELTKIKVEKQEATPGTSKPSAIDANEIKRDSPESNVLTSERNNNSEKAINEDAKSSENLTKQAATPSMLLMNDTQILKREFLLKTNVNKADAANQSTLSSQKCIKAKSVAKVYKPKTRMVDKVNAEKALKSMASEQNQKSTMTESTVVQNEQNTSKDALKSPNSTLVSPVSISSKPQVASDSHLIKKGTTDQSVALLLVLNNSPTSEAVKKSVGLSIIEKDKENEKEKIPAINQTAKDVVQTSPQKKESKARKSFPNKSRNCPQLVSHPSTNVLSNSIDSIVSVPSHQAENSVEYQMLPPEAGPVSARLYHGAQDLARKMARLMEEAYKEAAQENENTENSSSENHQATVHFLRLQIERMRWQHQQQLAELKHNTDRILREMKASLEAERLRAIEETHREAEEEKVRCIEEIKRKQWCAMCGREALFYCCWNTAYCDYPCQQSHWPMHMRTCAQKPSFTTIVTSSAAHLNQQENHNAKVNSSTGRLYALSHNKLNEISASLSLSYSRNEDNQDSS